MSSEDAKGLVSQVKEQFQEHVKGLLLHAANLLLDGTSEEPGLDWRASREGGQDTVESFDLNTPRGFVALVRDREAGFALHFHHGLPGEYQRIGVLTMNDWPQISALWSTVARRANLQAIREAEDTRRVMEMVSGIEQLVCQDGPTVPADTGTSEPPSEGELEGEDDLSQAVEGYDDGDEEAGYDSQAEAEDAFQQQMDETAASMVSEVGGPAAAEEFLSLPGEEPPSRLPPGPSGPPLKRPAGQVIRRGGPAPRSVLDG